MKKIIALNLVFLIMNTFSVFAQTDTIFVWYYNNHIDYTKHIDRYKSQKNSKVIEKKITYYLVTTDTLKSKIEQFNSLTQLEQDIRDEVPFDYYVFSEQINPRNPRGTWIETFEQVDLLKKRKIYSINEFEQNQYYNEFSKLIYLAIPDSSKNTVTFIKVINIKY